MREAPKTKIFAGPFPRRCRDLFVARQQRRRGYTLVFFAMMLFALMGLAALVIDIGLARLARRQMQTAADMAALEGLRFRDGVPDEWLNDAELLAIAGPPPSLVQIPNDPVWKSWYDKVRRAIAARQAANLFDDNLDATDGDPRQFGAGPQLNWTGGTAVGDGFNASQLITVPNNRSYKPQLAANLDNVEYGDILSGKFNKDYSHVKETDYSRDDFTAAKSVDDNRDSLLVRLRRTNETFADPNVATIGPPIPYLFGRGGLLALKNKADGISVRATTIAQALPVKSVGLPNMGIGLSGVTPFVIDLGLWNALQSNAMQIPPLTLSATVIGSSFSAMVNGGSFVTFSAPVQIGDTAPPANGAAVNVEGYTPITENNVIIGFGYVSMVINGTNVDLVATPKRIAHENASATFVRPIASLPTEKVVDGLLVPALVR